MKEGNEIIIETRPNELVLHPIVSDFINEGFGLFGKEKLNADQLKTFIERSVSISNLRVITTSLRIMIVYQKF